MPLSKPSPQLVAGIVARIPEGFITKSKLAERFRFNNRTTRQLSQAAVSGQIGRVGDVFYDPAWLTAEQAQALKTWCRPQFPKMRDDNTFVDAPILERLAVRDTQLTDVDRSVLDALRDKGYAERATLPDAVDTLLERDILKRKENLVYDPLRLGLGTIQEIIRQRELAPLREKVTAFLNSKRGKTASRPTLNEAFGKENVDALVNSGALTQFNVTFRRKPHKLAWVMVKGADERRAHQIAAEESRIPDEEWEPFLQQAGDVLRPDAKDGRTFRARVLARSYTLSNAARRLGAKQGTLERAVRDGRVAAFTDPAGSVRLAAADVERAYSDPDYALNLVGGEILTARDVALVAGLGYSAMRYRLQRANINRTEPHWEQVRGKWGLPEHLREFRDILRVRRLEWQAARHKAYMDEQQRQDEQYRQQREEERRRRAELRARLLTVFPTWEYEGREAQQIILRVGPPNSGKTHHALNALVEAGSGWYLAPLRLLAFEVFDRLNERGVPCSLLTGEEYIPVPGAAITAATIEMFNPMRSGECIVIDEAQMLADPERGWAWTRALMEARAPEIQIIAPYIARPLVERLASGVSLPVATVEHERLAEIRVADRPFRMKTLPPRTILVVFSRAGVLDLKTRLENMGRTVSVIYGNLPPEVRRKQSERFADGQTEICVATDAVGMGLNLPADNVCFFEIEKFDGQVNRLLTPSEVQQIGGRAGRFGLSQAGEVGAIYPQDHERLRKLFYAAPAVLTHARVMPTVEALEMLPGTLAERLREWAQLSSIPEHLRDVLKTANLTEPIELAQLLRPQEVEQLGLEKALRLINAPTRQSTRGYWRECATMILAERPMPLPPSPPRQILDHIHLEDYEASINCADIYLWLARRQEFSRSGPDENVVRSARAAWSLAIDEALLRRIESARRCSRCGRRLPRNHPYAICDTCYYGSRYDDFYDEDL